MSYGIKEDQNMPRKKHTPEIIVAKLRQVVVLVSQGAPVAEAVRQIGENVLRSVFRWWRGRPGEESGPLGGQEDRIGSLYP